MINSPRELPDAPTEIPMTSLHRRTAGVPSRAIVRDALAAAAAAALLGVSPPLAAQSATGSVPAPGRIWAAQTSPRELTLVWDSVPGATGFRLYRIGGSGADSARLIGNAVAAVRRWVVPVTTAMVSTPQQLAIEALDAAQRPSPRAAFNGVTPVAVATGGGPVPAPAAVTASEGGGGVTLTWDAVPGATAYAIGRSVAPAGFRGLCALCSTSTTYVDRNSTAGAIHMYAVTAVLPRGTSRATRSNEITPTGGGIVAGGGGTGGATTDSTAGTGGTGGTTTVTLPLAPTNVLARKVGTLSAELSWQASAGATSYKVSRRVCGAPAQAAGEVVSTAGLAFKEDIPMTAIAGSCPTGWQSVAVVYLVHSANAAGTSTAAGVPSPLSFEVIVPTGDGTGATGATALAPPMPLSATASGRSVTLMWQVSPGATGYQIYRAMCGSTPQPVMSVTPTPGYPSVTHLDQVPWEKINTMCPIGSTTAAATYGVAATGGGATSAPSKFPPVTLTFDMVIGTVPPPNVSGARAIAKSDGTVLLTWYRAPGVTSYRIERAVGSKATFQPLSSVLGDVSTYIDTTPKIAYMSASYRIISWNQNGSSPGVVVSP